MTTGRIVLLHISYIRVYPLCMYDICNKTYKHLKLRIKIQITTSGPLTTSHILNMYTKFPYNIHYKIELKIIVVKIPIKKHRNL